MNKFPLLLNAGFNNFIVTSQIVAILDYSIGAAKTIVRTARAERGARAVIDLTRGKKIYTLIILIGDRYVLSTKPRKQIARRLGAYIEETNVPPAKPRGRPKKADPPVSDN